MFHAKSKGSIPLQKVGLIVLILVALAVYLAFFLNELPSLVQKFDQAVTGIAP